jgi:DNA-binding NarL/FixJ family response regulator
VSLAEHSPLGRAGLLPAAVDLALETGDPSYAETLASELEETATRFGTAGLRARAAQTRAALLLAVDDPTAAIPLLEEAAQVYRDQRHRHASAQVHERLAAAHRALDDTARAAAEEATAMAIYARLGAAPDLARLDRHPRPGGLTDREVEVLRLVSTGSSNQQVADRLTISGKTVSRHLANIFVKIGVSTRTAAAAWARDHGL